MIPPAKFPEILDLAQIRPGDLPLVGAKAYNLGLLLSAGFPVANGFCITTRSFRYLSSHRRAAPLSHAPLRKAILAAYRKAGIRVAAVRSSAADEDRADGSGAGVYSSVLGVTGEKGLIEAVEGCYRSLQEPLARHYRRRRGASDVDACAMAVVVQELVDAEAAGVLFTVNPLTRSPLELHINAVRGLAEPLVAGRVSGDSFVVNPNGQVILETISRKSSMLTRAGEVAVPARDKDQPALDRRQLSELTCLGRAIEKFFGAPQDVEFAIAAGRIYVLQARPIPESVRRKGVQRREVDIYVRRERRRLTRRVATLRRAGKLRAHEAVFSNGNVGELLPSPTPMSFGLFKRIFAGRNGAIVRGRRQLGYTLAEDATEGLYELICGQPYFNVEIDAATFDMGIPLQAHGLIERIVEDPLRANYPEAGLYQQYLARGEAVARFGAAGERHYRAAGAFRRRMARNAKDFLRRFVTEIEPALREKRGRLGKAGSCRLCAEELLEDIDARISHLQDVSCVHFVIAARIGFFFADMTRLSLIRLFGSDAAQLWARLLQGLPGSRITRQMIDLESVAKGEMEATEFLELYGHLAATELEISLPRIAEDPSSVERMLRDLATSNRRPAAEFRRQIDRRMALESLLRRRLRRAGKATAAGRLFEELRLAQHFLAMRETLKYYYAMEYAEIRHALLRLGPSAGLEPGDIFYLYPEELRECLRPGPKVIEKIRRRKSDRRVAILLGREHRVPPVIFASRLEALGRSPGVDEARLLAGHAVAPGTAIGVARIIDLDAENLRRIEGELSGEEILVARSANLGLAPLLRIVTGLIVEIGGILAHGACQAREAGIPAVVVENATALLRNGAILKIDGDGGTVTVMD